MARSAMASSAGAGRSSLSTLAPSPAPAARPARQDFRGLARFVQAVRTSLYHEMSALVGAVILLTITHGHANQIGFWTYVTLWWMHESAKLNVFFGVPNLGEEMLPERLRYLASYMARRPMNMFFPFSVTISTIVTMWLAARAVSAASRSRRPGSHAGTLMALAVAEHWFLVAPLNGNALWGPMTRRSAADASALLESEFAALGKLRPASRPSGAAGELERGAAAFLRPPPSRPCAGVGRRRRLWRGRGGQGRHAHEGELDRLRDQWQPRAHVAFRAAAPARTADRRDRASLRSPTPDGRAGELRRLTTNLREE